MLGVVPSLCALWLVSLGLPKGNMSMDVLPDPGERHRQQGKASAQRISVSTSMWSFSFLEMGLLRRFIASSAVSPTAMLGQAEVSVSSYDPGNLHALVSLWRRYLCC